MATTWVQRAITGNMSVWSDGLPWMQEAAGSNPAFLTENGQMGVTSKQLVYHIYHCRS